MAQQPYRLTWGALARTFAGLERTVMCEISLFFREFAEFRASKI
jgi:hypothetical protein